MITKTRNQNTQNRKEEKEIFPLSNKLDIEIPEKIQKQINERWFYLYKWIWSNDIKASIQRDFLKILSKFWGFIWAAFILPLLILMYAESPFMFTYFWWFLIILNFWFISYLTYISLKRSNILRKNAFVLLTDSSSSIDWDIKKLNNWKLVINDYINKNQEIFEEKIFEKSNIEKTRKNIFNEVVNKLWDWFKLIWEKFWKSRWGKNGVQAALLISVLYSIYALSMSLIYFIWILFVWFFWVIMSIINKQILIISGHKITKINDKFEDIDNNSKELTKQKDLLIENINKAKDNDWKDSLLLEMNSWIKKINESVSNAIDTNIDLKDEIKSSKYKEMFNFWIYNSWIKKEIHSPLLEIRNLLEKNKEILEKQKNGITIQIEETNDPSLSWPLEISKTRIESRIKEIELHIEKMSLYINKLK